MRVSRNTVVTIDYLVTDIDGEVVDPGDVPIVYLHGGHDGIFPRIEQALEGRAVGDRQTVRLEPEDAFGDYDAGLITVEPRSVFPADLQVGALLQAQVEGADESDLRPFRVTDIADGKVVLDGNHPLAGMALNFSFTVTAIREASALEITLGGPAPEAG